MKSNALVQASYKLTLNQQRLILLAVSGLDSRKTGWRPGFDQVSAIRIQAVEFAEAWGLDMRDAYAALKDATNELFEGSLVEIDGKRVKKTRWVSSVQYHDGEGWAQLSFAPEIVPELTALRERFTEYRLGQVAGLRSTYAVRLFEWCIQFSETGLLIVTIEDLATRLGLKYKRYADMRRYVIEPAIEELRAKSNLKIEWEPVKKGRSVTSIKFRFREDPQGRLPV